MRVSTCLLGRLLLGVSILCCADSAAAHPMGNFSVNHYSKLEAHAGGVALEYVLDLAELPTFELLREWGLERTSPRAALDRKAAEQALAWLAKLRITTSGKAVPARLEDVQLVVADGAGGLPILRITAHARLNAPPGALSYEDTNYPDRAGWKEIVITGTAGAALKRASHGAGDISQGLTHYPSDPLFPPPQNLRAQFEWSRRTPAALREPRSPASPAIVPIPQPAAKAAVAPATRTPSLAPAGSVVRGDFLSTLIRQRELSLWMILTALGASFLLGAAHALTPGHGKTLVAAYLVGSRGTARHAAFLGGMVTFTHTVAVFILGIATLCLVRFIVPEKITQILEMLSGLSILGLGVWMLAGRLRRARVPAAHHHPDAHSHPHHHHPHVHDHAHTHDHHHHHGPEGHSHIPESISWGSLVALGASGGLVPCESALVLLLGAVALGRIALGLALVLSFSLGLALVLILIGMLVLYAKHLLPSREKPGMAALFRWIPIASAAFVTLVGVVTTSISLGWLTLRWMI